MVLSATTHPVSDGTDTAGERLPGEGATKYVKRTRERVPCEECGEPADNRHTYLLPNARRNPASSGYGRDDVSRCSDMEVFTCKACRDAEFYGREPRVDGYEWCSTFYNMKAMPHMFLRWVEEEIPSPAVTSPELDDSQTPTKQG